MSEQTEPNSTGVCPECGASLAARAILCVGCGYHLQLRRRLQTEIVPQATARLPQPAESNPNPYAPPRPVQVTEDQGKLQLTEASADWARAIVSDAHYMPWLLVAGLCCCMVPLPLMLPYYAYRLANWRKLDATYAELHSPNSFSPYGQLAAEFQDAKFLLISGVVAGGIFYIGVITAVIVNRVQPL